MLLLPLYGIQLETHRGLKPPFLPALRLTASRRFIPLTSVRDVVINEGLHRWDVRYYICIIRDIGSEVTLEVAFEVRFHTYMEMASHRHTFTEHHAQAPYLGGRL